VALLFEEMGRALLPSPFFGSWLALEALRRAGKETDCERLYPAIVRGERNASLAFLEPGGSWEPDDLRTTAEPVPGGFRLSGTKTHVMFGASAHVIIVPAREPSGEVSLFVVDLPSKKVSVEPESTLDATRRMVRVELDGALVSSAAKLERDGRTALGETFLRAFAMLACEMVGGAERILGLTRDYAISRIQFGRPIGSFQAVKHPIVDAMVGVEHARSLSLAAAVALDVDARRAEPLARGAKAFASDIYVAVAKKGVQLHGGYGFTWDCDVHFWFKRAVVSRGLLGEPVFHRQRIADALLGEVRGS
jgi:alkylation response protein AidB-like acyl-CoA dehydrogenase